MSDGANLGMKPEAVLGVVLGGKPAESAPRLSDDEFAAWIRSASDKPGDEFSYDDASRSIAKFFVRLFEEVPESRSWSMDRVWDESKIRFAPDFACLGEGASGFMVGWAYNAASKVVGATGKPNPALVEIEIDD